MFIKFAAKKLQLARDVSLLLSVLSVFREPRILPKFNLQGFQEQTKQICTPVAALYSTMTVPNNSVPLSLLLIDMLLSHD